MSVARLAGLAVLSACSAAPETVLDVRTTLPEELRDYVEDTFEEAHPTVDVRFSESDAAASFAELSGRGASPAATDSASASTAPFDVWWGASGVTLESAADAGLLFPYRPPWLAQPGVGEPNGEGRWQAILVTPFVIAFNREDLQLTRAPTDWIDLFHLRWIDEVSVLDPIRAPEGADFMGSMIVEGLRAEDDLDRGFEWLERLDGQVESYVGTSDEAVRALRSGDARLAILPHADVERARGEDAPWLHYRLAQSGTPMSSRGVAIASASAELEAARAFVDHLGRIDVATASKLYTRWQPAHGDVDMSKFPPDFEIEQRWTSYTLAVDTLEAEGKGWMDRWDLEVRGR